MTQTTREVAGRGRIASLRRPWSGPVGGAAIGLIVLQALWRGWYVGRGFFTQDDFMVLRMAHERPLHSLLLTDYYGHLLPARWVLASVVANAGTLNWALAAAMILVLQALTAAVMWVLLTRMLPDRWVRLPLLALFCFAPLTLWTTQQWIVAMQFFPVTICLLLSIIAILRFLEQGWRPGVWVPPVLTAVALLFQERAILFVIAYAGIALTTVPGSFWARILTVLRRLWLTWLAMVVVLVGYFVLHAVTAPIKATPLATQSSDLVALFGNFVFKNAVPGLVTGPWRGEILGDAGAVLPPAWAVFLAPLLLGLVVGVTSVRGGQRAWWAWLVMGTYLVADVGILFGGKSQFGVEIGLIPRYAVDLVPVLVVVLAAALRDVDTLAIPARLRRMPPGVLAGGGVAVILLGALATTLVVAPVLENRDDRAYAHNLVRQLREHPDIAVFDAVPPGSVMIRWFGRATGVATILSTMDPPPRLDVPSADLRVPDERGILHPASVSKPVLMQPGPTKRCGYPISTRPTTIAMTQPLFPMRHLVRLDFYSGGDSRLTVAFGTGPESPSVELASTTGLHSVFVPVDQAFDAVVAHNDTAKVTVCLAQVAAGEAAPRAD